MTSPSSMRPKTCRTCARRTFGTFDGAECEYSGMYCSTERKFGIMCGPTYKGWVEREGLIVRLSNWLFGERVKS